MKVLFVSHDASQTGAPIVLLHFISWLQTQKKAEVTILLKKSGPLYHKFCEVSTTYIWSANQPSESKWVRRLSKFTNKFFGKILYRPFPNQLNKKKFDLIYLNTVASLDLAPFLKEKFQCPVIGHIHENEYSINRYYKESLNSIYTRCVNYFIAVSNGSKENLIANYQIPEKAIALFNPFIDVSVFTNPKKPDIVVRQALNIKESFVVGGSGITCWRKGVDLFLYTAVHIKRHFPEEDIVFVWVGEISEEFKIQLEYELKRLNIEDRIIFTGSTSCPQDYFQIMDLFLLTSREDPFPLVCLEAAALSKPIICFNKAGGMTEFIELSGGGMEVSYGNIMELSSVIIQLKHNTNQRKALGALAKTHINKYDVETIGPQIFNFMQACLKFQ